MVRGFVIAVGLLLKSGNPGLFSLSRELSRISEMSCVHFMQLNRQPCWLSTWDSWSESFSRPHPLFFSFFLQVPLMFYPGSQRARSWHSVKCNPSVFPSVFCVPRICLFKMKISGSFPEPSELECLGLRQHVCTLSCENPCCPLLRRHFFTLCLIGNYAVWCWNQTHQTGLHTRWAQCNNSLPVFHLGNGAQQHPFLTQSPNQILKCVYFLYINV